MFFRPDCVYTASGSVAFQHTSFPIPLVQSLSVPRHLMCYRCHELTELVPHPRGMASCCRVGCEWIYSHLVVRSVTGMI